MLASAAAWRGVARALDGARLTCPDLPGHGCAPDWDGERPYMDAAAEVALTSAPEGRFDLLGHSYGGCVALRLLADHPGRIRSLVLVEPVMFAAAAPALREAQRRGQAPYAAAMARGDREAAARAFTGAWGGGGDWDALPDRQRAYIRDRIHLVAASSAGIVDDAHDVLDRLPAAPPPVRIVTRADPPAIVEGIAQGLAARLRGARVARLGRGHMIPMEAPEDLARLVQDVWRG